MLGCTDCVAILAIVACVSACSRNEVPVDAGVRKEAGELAHIVERLREAPNADKQLHLERLTRALCTVADTCSLKDRCRDAYGALSQALRGIDAAKAAASSGSGDTSAAALLGEAQRNLERAHARTLDCATAHGELMRRYRL